MGRTLAERLWKFRGQKRPPFATTPGPGQESVWDYPRPPVLVADPREVRVAIGDVSLALSRRCARILETASPPTFYIPPEDVTTGALVANAAESHCEWKGTARYWDLRAGNHTIASVAWSYPQPFDEFAPIRDWFAFYPGRVDCFVADQPVEAQDGGFYGGWITSELVGPFKGEPGTGGW